jgi:hypothetical protein
MLDETHPCPSEEGMLTHSASLFGDTVFNRTFFNYKMQ